MKQRNEFVVHFWFQPKTIQVHSGIFDEYCKKYYLLIGRKMIDTGSKRARTYANLNFRKEQKKVNEA